MRALLAPLAVLLACGPGAPALEASTGGSDDTGASTGPDDGLQQFQCVEQTKLDILFVIEDAPAMAAAQAGVRGLTDVLFSFLPDSSGIDYRVAFIGAEIVGPHCPGAVADDGAFIGTSCRARLGDFPGELADRCTEACGLDAVPTLPTTVAGQAEARPRPWIERIGASNLGDLDPREAAACLALQGAAGCEYQAPLAALDRALDRTADPADPAFGFLRADARLHLVFVAASPECSFADGALGILDPNGDRVFWSDPDVATPGACWNAGVRCSGDPARFTDCTPSNHDLAGAADVADDQAVLRPVGELVDRLRALIADGRTTGVTIAVLAGLEAGSDASVYSRDCAPEQLAATAICPGCTTADGLQPTPPVRLRALAEAFRLSDDHPADLTSLCAPEQYDWDGVAPNLKGQINPFCVDTCAHDQDPQTPVIDPVCRLTATAPGEPPRDLPRCQEVLGEWQVPAGADACFAVLVDRDRTTPSPLDDMSPECADADHNAEFIVRRTTAPVDGLCYAGTCEPSTDPTRDCPYR